MDDPEIDDIMREVFGDDNNATLTFTTYTLLFHFLVSVSITIQA